jgi:hypothetical protein
VRLVQHHRKIETYFPISGLKIQIQHAGITKLFKPRLAMVQLGLSSIAPCRRTSWGDAQQSPDPTMFSQFLER